MVAINGNDLSKIKSDEYWDLVSETLEQVFSKDPSQAIQLKQNVKKSSPEQQVLFYHSDPLSIAAEIADVKQLTSEQIKGYKKLRAHYGFSYP